jgi:hypothetical protein
MTVFRSLRRNLALAALLVVTVVAWLWLRKGNRAVESAHSDGSELASSSTWFSHRGNVPPKEGEEQATGVVEKLPVPPCWEGLFALDDRPTLHDLRDALRSALAASGDDPLLLEYLQDRLSEVIGNDAQAALQVVGWASSYGPPLSTHLLAAVKNTEAVQQKGVAEKLLALGGDVGQNMDLRRAALGALETQKTLGTEALGQLRGVAMDARSDEVAWMATRTIGKVMSGEFARSGQAGAYVKELLDIGQHSGDPAVRSLALEMPSYGNIPMGSAQLGTLAKVLANDPDRGVREMAAFRLGLSDNPDQALTLFALAYEKEKDLCVRWAIFRFAVRAAGQKSLPTLEKFANLDPRLRPDYEDFAAIYARGVVDFERVWLEKKERIQCLDDG